MAGRKKDQAVQEFNHLTERLKAGRVRFRLPSQPEIVAWLLVHRQEAERRLAEVQRWLGTKQDPVARGIIEAMTHRCRAIDYLTVMVGEPWSRVTWHEVAGTVALAMGVEEGKGLPAEYGKPPIGEHHAG